MTKVKRPKAKPRRVVKPPAKMRAKPTGIAPELDKPLRYPDAVDMRNIVLGAAITFKLDYKAAQEFHQEYKRTAKTYCGWIETGGDHGNDAQAVYDECCASLRRLFGM